MRQLTQGTLSRPSTRPMLVVTIARRTLGSLYQTSHNTSTFDNRAAEEEITSIFPGDRVAPEAGEHPRQRRRRGDGEADTLLSDILALGKQVSDEQRRSRVSIPASRLRNASLKTRSPLRGAPGGPASSVQLAKWPPDAKQVITPPPLSPLAPVVRASTRERPAVLPPTLSSSSEAALPPLQSWTPAFVLTPQNLQTTADAHGASDIAFTLEELEETLFSPAVEQREGDAIVTKAEAPTTVLTPPLPPPPMAPAMPCSEAPPAPLKPIASPQTSDTVGATAPPLAQPAAAPRPAPDDLMTASPTASTAVCARAVVDVATTCPLSSTSPTPSEHCSPEKESARTLLVASVLRCRMRGSAVEVSMTRPPQSPRELLEALHEAVSFVESLPALPQGPRLVYLGVDSTSSACASYSFLESQGLTEVISTVEERVAAQLLKERLLLRITEGPALGLRYIAELRTAGLEAPVVIRDTAAELLLACSNHEVRYGAWPGVPLNGTTVRGVVRLSFSGIGIGIFPAPSTVLKLERAVTAMCLGKAERSSLIQALARASGRSSSAVAALLPVDIVSEVMQHLHTVPIAVSAALLRQCVSSQGDAREGAVEAAGNSRAEKARWCGAAWPMTRRWWGLLQERRREMWSGRNKAPVGCCVRMSSCVTANEVWRCLCEAILSPTADDVSTRQAVFDAMHSAPVRRCRQNYLFVASPGLVHGKTSAPLLPAVVVDVTASSLQRASVADLASEIREQPADVVLVLSEDVRLPQKLRFLSSLHLTDTGSHHRVTVLLPGDPAEIDECVCLTQSSARLASQQSCCEAGLSKVHPCDPHWLHQLIEVSNARTSADVPGCSPALHGAAPASLGELYVAHAWRRPCVTTQSSSVGLKMSAVVAVSWQRFIAGATGGARRKALVEQFQCTHLAPLVMLRTHGGGPAWWTTYGDMSMTQEHLSGSATVPRLMKSISAAWLAPSSDSALIPLTSRSTCVAECGVAFLFVLDVACQSLLRRAIDSPEQLNVLSIAALGLDTSAGGLLEVADRVAGHGVETIVFAMEDATTVHGVRFASLPLLRWMMDNRVLFYQLTPQTMERYITCCHELGV